MHLTAPASGQRTISMLIRASMPYSRLLYSYVRTPFTNVPPSDELWSIIPTSDQLYLPQINYPDHWSAVPNNDYLSPTSDRDANLSRSKLF